MIGRLGGWATECKEMAKVGMSSCSIGERKKCGAEGGGDECDCCKVGLVPR